MSVNRRVDDIGMAIVVGLDPLCDVVGDGDEMIRSCGALAIPPAQSAEDGAGCKPL